MNGQELKDLRQRKGWSQADVARLINEALDRKTQRGTVGQWENGRRPISRPVSDFLDRIAAEEPEFTVLDGEREVPFQPDDLPPPPPPGSEPQVQLPLLPGGSQYARVCEELWELVATGVGMIGAVTGSEKLQEDGRIIVRDKAALGKAYGKLAEQNATFRHMLAGMTGGGAWLEVALVSGITAGKLLRNHQTPKLPPVVAAEAEEPEGVRMRGDGGVVVEFGQ